MLVELAIGDAYGAGFEYVRDRRFISLNNTLCTYVKHPRHRRKPGVYTDDTQMSVAIAELIIERAEWTPLNIASKFVEVFHRDPRPGYAGGFQAFLKRTKTGPDFIRDIRPNSDKSGAAMRVCPIGVYATAEEVIERAAIQAGVTHDTPDGKNAAIAAALMAHFFVYDCGAKNELPDFLAAHVPGPWREPWIGEVGSRGMMSVRAALTSVMKNDSLASILKSAVAWGGDTDTVATIALAVASCCREIVDDIPERLHRNLENGRYGRRFLQETNERLMASVKQTRRRTTSWSRRN